MKTARRIIEAGGGLFSITLVTAVFVLWLLGAVLPALGWWR